MWKSALKYAPLAGAIAFVLSLGIAVAIPFLGWVSGNGELRANVAHLDRQVGELDDSVNNLRVEVSELRVELLKAIQDSAKESTAETARMMRTHRHDAGEVYVEIP